MPQGFWFQQEPLLSYKAGEIVYKRAAGLWVVAVTERVVRICSGLLIDAKEEYRL